MLILLSAIVTTGLGVVLFLNYTSGGQSYNQTPKAGIGIEWGQSGGKLSPALDIDFTPRMGGSNLNSITFDVATSFYSNNSFAFAFTSPYTILKQGQPSTVVGDGSPATWTYKNFGNASLIYFTYDPRVASNHPDHLDTVCNFEFTGLTYRNDHGLYSVELPFSAGGPQWVWRYVIQKSPQLVSNSSVLLHFTVDLPTNYTDISSTPPYSSVQTFLNDGSRPFKAIRIDTNQVDDLSIDYQNTDAINTYSYDETLGVLFIGVGLPLALTMPMEVRRARNERRRKRGVRIRVD